MRERRAAQDQRDDRRRARLSIRRLPDRRRRTGRARASLSRVRADDLARCTTPACLARRSHRASRSHRRRLHVAAPSRVRRTTARASRALCAPSGHRSRSWWSRIAAPRDLYGFDLHPGASRPARRLARQRRSGRPTGTRRPRDRALTRTLHMPLKIDVFNHIFPQPFFDRLQEVTVNRGRDQALAQHSVPARPRGALPHARGVRRRLPADPVVVRTTYRIDQSRSSDHARPRQAGERLT